MYTKFHFLYDIFVTLNNFYCLMYNKNLTLSKCINVNVIPSSAAFRLHNVLFSAIIYYLAQSFKILGGKISKTQKNWNKNQRNNTKNSVKLGLINILFRSVVISRSDILFWPVLCGSPIEKGRAWKNSSLCSMKSSYFITRRIIRLF